MLTSSDEKTRPVPSRATTVNKAALTAWLQAWTTGASFPTVPRSNLNASLQTTRALLTRLRRV